MEKELLNTFDKELLLKDLCARLPYGVKVQDELGRINKLVIGNADLNRLYYNDFSTYSEEKLSLPYLFPLSSMTEEQYNEFFSYYHNIEMAEIKASGDYLKAACIGDDAKCSWLNENHFDYRGLIEKGLAIDATGLNIY